jgi:hypothetical protein
MLKSRRREHSLVPRRKYGRLTKVVEIPPKDNCSRCRAGKPCLLPGHSGNIVSADREWQGPEAVDKRTNKKNPAKK